MLKDRDSASVASGHAEVSRGTTRVCGDGEWSGGGVEGYGVRSLTVAGERITNGANQKGP